MKNNCDNMCTCNLHFDDDGYDYILEELTDIRNRTDRIISLIKSRQEKNNLIDEVLNTECDEEEDDCKNKNMTALDEIMRILAIQKIFDYPTTYPYRINTTSYPFVYPRVRY